MSASQHPQLPQCSCRHSINVGTPQVSNDGAISSTTVSKRCRQQHGGKRLGPYLPSCLSRRSLGTTTTASEPSLGRNVSWKPTSCPVTCHSQPSTAPASRDTCRGSQQWATDVTNHAAPLQGAFTQHVACAPPRSQSCPPSRQAWYPTRSAAQLAVGSTRRALHSGSSLPIAPEQ